MLAVMVNDFDAGVGAGTGAGAGAGACADFFAGAGGAIVGETAGFWTGGVEVAVTGVSLVGAIGADEAQPAPSKMVEVINGMRRTNIFFICCV